MKYPLLPMLAVSAIIPATIFAAPLPENLEDSLDKAYTTRDDYILQAVTTRAKSEYPGLTEEIDRYITQLQPPGSQEAQPEQTANTEAELHELSPAAGEDHPKDPWKGSVELGAAYATGNSEQENLNADAEIIYQRTVWENTLELKAVTSKEDQVRTSEEYRANEQLRRNLSPKDYVFGELEYVNDRFSGYEYRTSELFGYGYHFIKQEDMQLTGEASLGLQQSSRTNGEDDNSLLSRFSGNFAWDINNNLTFTENLTVSIASDATITESETALKSKISESLYLKASFEVEHISDVPPGTENTDTITTLKLGYDF